MQIPHLPASRLTRLMINLTPFALTRHAFAPFGQVIEVPSQPGNAINSGTAVRHDNLATIDTAQENGQPVISLFVAQPRQLPLRLQELEQHPLGSQAFMPLDSEPYLVVVAGATAEGLPDELRAFIARGDQGINLDRGVWHHPLLALNKICRFLVVDRIGPGDNLTIAPLPSDPYQICVSKASIDQINR